MRKLCVVVAVLLLCGGAAAGSVQRIGDLDYAGDGFDAHRLDLYLPADRTHAAIVVFVHGGAFLGGDRRDYASVGRALAKQGLAVAVVSYRVFPQTDAGGAVQDVARATAWTIRNAARYGLNPRNLFLVGHSAGAQIVAVLGTNATYLQDAGVTLAAVRGVFAVAGAYDVRDLSGEPDDWQALDGHIYGHTPQARSAFSPALHIDPNTPPTVTACGTSDDPGSCARATNFTKALLAAGIASVTVQENGADHMGMLRALIAPNDPLNAALHYFITKEEL